MTPKEITKEMTQDEMAYERTEMSSERTAMAEERTSLALERTEMALERTSLANSQTLLAYCRTAIGSLAAGIGMLAFVSNEKIVMLGCLLTLLAPVIVGIGFSHYFLVRKKLRELDENSKKNESQEKTED